MNNDAAFYEPDAGRTLNCPTVNECLQKVPRQVFKMDKLGYDTKICCQFSLASALSGSISGVYQNKNHNSGLNFTHLDLQSSKVIWIVLFPGIFRSTGVVLKAKRMGRGQRKHEELKQVLVSGRLSHSPWGKMCA